ncbi:hypothetical protein V8E54_014131 [Elaphomyces granulatus]
MTQQPTYMLAPNFHFKLGTGPIALGNIIADPLRPHRAVTTIDEDTLKRTYPHIKMVTDYDRRMTYVTSPGMITDYDGNMVHKTGHGLSIDIWKQFVQTTSAKVSSELGTHTNYTMDALETTFFITDPPIKEIAARVKAPRVRAVINSIAGFQQPLYMVTGLKIARGFAVQERGKHRAGAVEISKTAEDIVFAYQLLRIDVKIEYGSKASFGHISDSDDDDDSDEEEIITKRVMTSRIASVDNLDITGGITKVELGEGESKITCISARDGGKNNTGKMG